VSEAKYLALQPPLAPGLVTLGDYAESIGRTKAYLQVHWKPADGFPEPTGELPPRGRHGGGRGELVYSRAALDAFRLERDSLRVARSSRLIIGHSLEEWVTLEEFGGICGITRAPDRFPGCPPAGALGLRRLADLVAWHNTLPPAAGPRLTITPLGPRELVTKTGFARIVGVHPTTVAQYRHDPEFPSPADAKGKLYRLGQMASWWNARPGKVPVARERKGARPAHRAPGSARARTATATAARTERALEILGAAAPGRAAATGRLRVAHPQASLEEPGQLSDPPLSKDNIAYRLRRLLAMADQRASDLGLPGTAPDAEHAPAERPSGEHA
jgi:hypothetical protein